MTVTEAITEAVREERAAQQPVLLTGGRKDHTGCYALVADFWRSEADMCPQPATHHVCFDDYRSGVTTGGEFDPGETHTSVCPGHEEQVRRAPGFRWSRPIEVTR